MTITKHGIILEGLIGGETLIVEPLSPWTLTALNNKAEKIYPDIDAEPFMESVETITGEQRIFDENRRDEYNELMEPVMLKRREWIQYQAIMYCVDTVEPRSDVIMRHSDRIQRLRDILGDEIPADAWEATLFYSLIRSIVDRGYVYSAIQTGQAMALQEGELAEARGIFRIDLSGKAGVSVLRKTYGL